MKRFGSRELLENVIHQDLCISCGACQDLCPYFRSYRGKTAMLFPCTQAEGRCFAYCPKAEVDLDGLSRLVFDKPYGTDPLGSYLSIAVSRAGERVARAPFQSGGTVSALMQFALETGRITGAILTAKDGFTPIPTIATSAEAIRACASSKYTAAPTLAALHQAVKKGVHNLGLVATPCQSLAAAQMRGFSAIDDPVRDALALVVGLFCTWSLDFRAFEAFLSDRMAIDRIRKIDIPPPPAEILEVFTDDDKQEFSLREIRELVPASCAYCHDMTAEFSDISVGVVEGRPDWNTLIVRTVRGEALVREARQEGWLIVEDLPAENLEHLRWAAGNKKRRALLKGQQKGLIGAPGGQGFAALRIRPETLQNIMGTNTEDTTCHT